MNITITENPYEGENITISTRGVMTDAKIAKLNNATKRPAIVKNWEKDRPVKIGTIPGMPEEPKDYTSLLNNIGISAVNYATNSNNTGAKKLRVNKIVCEKSNRIYANSNKIDVIPKVEEKPVVPVEPPKEERPSLSMEPNIVSSRSDIHGRHEHTGEIPVNEIREAVRNDTPVINRTSRLERNASVNDMLERNEMPKESKAGDMDLYNDLLHSSGMQDDVSKQLQGARKELSIEREESKKLAERYGEAVKELEELKADIANARKEKEQKDKQELSATLNDLETLKKENLERTSDLSSIQAEIARLKAERRAMEDNFYDDFHSYGRAA